jgi:hypothetical protein
MDAMDSARHEGHVIISVPPPPELHGVHQILRRRKGKYYDASGKLATDGILHRGRVLHDSKNNITLAGRVRFGELACGLSGDFPDRIAVGDGGLEAGTSAPKIPRDDDTTLEHEVSRIVVAQRILNEDDIPSMTWIALFKTAGSYQFAQVGQTQISECGLFCRDDVMTNNHNFAPIPVDVHRIGVMIEWEVVIL